MKTITAQEEAQLVLDDVFIGIDVDTMNLILQDFFMTHNVEFDWDTNEEEMNDMLIDEQDSLEEIRDRVLETIFT